MADLRGGAGGFTGGVFEEDAEPGTGDFDFGGLGIVG